MTPELAAENAQVLNLVQAMLGLLTPNIRLITLEMMSSGNVEVLFLIERDDPRTREDLDDIIGDFAALQSAPIVSFRVLVDERPLHEIQPSGRRVYCRNEYGDDYYGPEQ